MLRQARSAKPLTFDLQGAFLRKTDFSGATLRGAKLDRADFTGASFGNADFKDARMVGTILKGADLSTAVNLTVDQLIVTIIDDATRLPTYIDRARLLGSTLSKQ